MSDNYLWDRSGEPDPEVRNLEEILGTLRYQPRSLEIPAGIQVRRRQSLSLALAIAAAIALLALALGLWLHFNQPKSGSSFEAKRDLTVDQKGAPQQPQVLPDKQVTDVAVVDTNQTPRKRHGEPAQNLLSGNRTRIAAREIRQPELTPRELAEKQEVLLALRLVSAKLNVAQRKTQGAPSLNIIRNQHKIG